MLWGHVPSGSVRVAASDCVYTWVCVAGDRQVFLDKK